MCMIFLSTVAVYINHVMLIYVSKMLFIYVNKDLFIPVNRDLVFFFLLICTHPGFCFDRNCYVAFI